jgi:hypothetical protein
VADPILNEINLTTNKVIYPVAVEDNLFLDTPFQAYLRAKCLRPFTGGANSQNVFLVAPMIGGAYPRGGSFNVQKRQTIAGTVFDMRFYEVAIPEFLEDLEVYNKGPAAVFKLVDIDLRNAMQTISTQIAIDLALHGRASGTGITDNRPDNLNGWIEAINDGITPGWNGDYFTSYGTQVRNGFVGNTLNSVPFWNGDSAGNSQPITYNVLEETYQDACPSSRVCPNLGVGNKAVIAYVKELMQVQQRFAQERDPVFGASGFKFNDAMILTDQYFPSLKYGQNDPDLGNWLTSSFTSPATVGATSNMPTNTSCTVGEVFAWFNTSKWKFRISDSRQFGFGFSGFIPAQDNTRVVGHVKAAVNLECLAPRTNKQLFGISG